MSQQETTRYKCLIKFGSNDDFKLVHNVTVKFKGAPQFSLREHCEQMGYTKCLVSVTCSAVIITATGSGNKIIKEENGDEKTVYDGETHIPLIHIFRVAIDYLTKDEKKNG